ncbi:MAG: lipoyl synthase [Acidimicrobiia bacterium]
MLKDKLYVRSLGVVDFHEALSIQNAFHSNDDDYLLLLEHNPIFTCGSGIQEENLLDVKNSGIKVVDIDRGGDVTFHGPGQLIGYPIITLGETRGDLRNTIAFLRSLEEVIIEALKILGIQAIRFEKYTGVWIDLGPEYKYNDRYKKIAAIGSKVSRGRTKHGFALNVSTDLSYFDKIIPCGIEQFGVTSLHELGHTNITFDQVIDTVTKTFLNEFNYNEIDIASHSFDEKEYNTDSEDEETTASKRSFPASRSALAFEPVASSSTPDQGDLSRFSVESVSAIQPSLRLLGRLSKAGVRVDLEKDRRNRPDWMKNTIKQTEGFKELKELSKDLNLVSVCEEAGCPNIYECWESKTATYMILGENCTRACSFCLVGTNKPAPPDTNEPKNVAIAIKTLGIKHAVITCVARDDLEDDGSTQFVNTVNEVRKASPGTQIELLISDNRGHENSLDKIFNSRPDILNHNIETPIRIQRAVRPSANYARSLGVLTRAKEQGLKTKSGIIVGMGETNTEILQTLRDLKNANIDIVTIGQYLQPTPTHLPVDRFVTPAEFDEFKRYGESIGIPHVESGPLVRSSYHAAEAVDNLTEKIKS